MSETLPMKIAVGDEVRVHFHPPGSWKSFSEGVVRRVDVTTPEGRFFVLEVRNEVLLDRPHRIRPDFHDYVPYEGRSDFPGRIEVLTPAAQYLEAQDPETEPASLPASVKAPAVSLRGADEQYLDELDLSSESETERTPEAAGDSEPDQVDVEPQPVHKQGGLISALFGRRE
ncbi:hypothetical protein [Microvirga lotononidis]|uniref:Uncharacterized protein n=1 Tax=Microvirga lotononidis TaxID=864069 RepID=I4Z3P9_9HYPH|nr:hypothetical protein [Microvirga lotononidis]EIM30841.1 hypothetical protein MicloDRAFT_00003680 [Microvirga lotononidis]WQO31776.1 hypothetical protein U0023_30960 [Microvirga lotononidis]